MKSRQRLLLIAFLLAFSQKSPFAFETGQHQAITKAAADKAGQDCPDIAKFENTILIPWSGGTGALKNASGAWEKFFIGLVAPSKPAQELAHLGNQVALLDDTQFLDGGDYDIILSANITPQFLKGNFANQAATHEGAYVWMGAAVHLIEDQASTPHAANIYHDGGDQFEGPVGSTFGDKNTQFNLNQLQLIPNQAKENLYRACLLATQQELDSNTSYQEFFNQTYAFVPYWIPNDKMKTKFGFSQYSSTRYDGTPPDFADPDPSVFGAYIGVLNSYPAPNVSSNRINTTSAYQADLYTNPNPIYDAQGLQAANYAYTFFEEMSKSFPPIVSQVSMGSTAGVPIVDGVGETPVTFTVIENRTSNVNVDIFVQETGQRIASHHATLSIDLQDAGYRAPGNSDHVLR